MLYILELNPEQMTEAERAEFEEICDDFAALKWSETIDLKAGWKKIMEKVAAKVDR